ncbi:MAG TPA: hypothetical protein VGS22_11925 [Thermoanaerobaculia bacterium]|jgi:hypothetical protein|nr:hypothetical protein [Thermoanaerobaculia bacterium]
MADEIAVHDEPLGRTCLGLPFVGQRPLTDCERRRAERRLARRRILRGYRTVALGAAGLILLFSFFPQARLDFYRDSELSLLGLGSGACLGGALVGFLRLGKEMKNLRLDLTAGRVERYERRAEADPEAAVVGQASILPLSRLEVGLGGRRSRAESPPLSESEKADLAPSSTLNRHLVSDTSLRLRIREKWRRIQPSIQSPRALLAVVPFGCSVLLISIVVGMPPDPTASQVLAIFVWVIPTILSWVWLLDLLEGEEPAESPVETGESSQPRPEKPAPSTGEVRRRGLRPSERDRLAHLASRHNNGFWIAIGFPIVLGVLLLDPQPRDRWWSLAVVFWAVWTPFWVSSLRDAWAAIQLRRDLRAGTVIAGDSATEDGEIEWLARSRFPWTEDGEPVAWRRE